MKQKLGARTHYRSFTSHKDILPVSSQPTMKPIVKVEQPYMARSNKSGQNQTIDTQMSTNYATFHKNQRSQDSTLTVFNDREKQKKYSQTVNIKNRAPSKSIRTK